MAMQINQLTWDVGIQIFREYTSAQGGEFYLSPRTTIRYIQTLNMLKNHFSDTKQLYEITYNDLSEYIQYLRRNRRSHSYVSYCVFSIRSAFSLWSILGHLPSDPSETLTKNLQTRRGARIANRVRMRKTEPISEENLLRLFITIDSSEGKFDEKLKERDWLMLSIILCSGLRNSEMTSIRFRDIDFSERKVSVRRKGGEIKSVYLTDLLKIPYTDYIPHVQRIREENLNLDKCLLCHKLKIDLGDFNGSICPECQMIWLDNYPSIIKRLRRYCNKHGFQDTDRIFPITPLAVWFRVKYWSRKAMLSQSIFVHSFRHSFGTMLAKQKLSGFAIQSLMDHKSINTTSIYVTLDQEQDIKDILNEINMLNEERFDTTQL